MPEKGFDIRGRQLATLASLAHEMLTAESYGDLLQELSSRNDLDEQQKANVRLSFEDYTKDKKLPNEFVEAINALFPVHYFFSMLHLMHQTQTDPLHL